MYQKKSRNQWRTLEVKRKGRLDKSLPLCPGAIDEKFFKRTIDFLEFMGYNKYVR